jgi:hypothetical protein
MNLENFISVDDFLMGRAMLDQLTDEQKANLNTLIPRVNIILEQFHRDNPTATKRGVNSGYRRPSDNAKVPNPKPKSNHLICAAIDLGDKDRLLATWVMNNLKLLKDNGLWLESVDYTPNWVHFQCFPPKSGNRVFIPG